MDEIKKEHDGEPCSRLCDLYGTFAYELVRTIYEPYSQEDLSDYYDMETMAYLAHTAIIKYQLNELRLLPRDFAKHLIHRPEEELLEYMDDEIIDKEHELYGFLDNRCSLHYGHSLYSVFYHCIQKYISMTYLIDDDFEAIFEEVIKYCSGYKHIERALMPFISETGIYKIICEYQ